MTVNSLLSGGIIQIPHLTYSIYKMLTAKLLLWVWEDSWKIDSKEVKWEMQLKKIGEAEMFSIIKQV